LYRQRIIKSIAATADAVLHSYGLLFFSNSKVFGALILLVTLLFPYSGLAGLASVAAGIFWAHAIGFEKTRLRQGVYTYSALIFGLGLGTFYEWGGTFWLLLAVGAMFTLLLSAFFFSRLSRNGVPALSIAFICTTWVVLLASRNLGQMGLAQRHIYWYNELYRWGGARLLNLVQTIEGWSLPAFVSGFLRSLSGIVFQGSLAGGMLLAIGLLFYSRIAFVLMIYGYAVALGFHKLIGSVAAGSMSYYQMGTNYMLVAAALGGFFLIPSWRSFLWILVLVPVTNLLVLALSAVLEPLGLPVLSLPFCITVILFLYCLQLRPFGSKLVVAPVQYYSPEHNLYHFLHGRARAAAYQYLPLSLPVLGEWMVSQGYNGSMTHKGDWREAVDFVLLDNELKTYRNPGNETTQFYCFGKPVLAPADGFVEELVDGVTDNTIGGNNTDQNWGNTIVLRHAEGLYTKLSHLKNGSSKVAKGDYVKRGDIIALCGNSGRSPEPHLHFQVQATPYVGSRTLHYPIAFFLQRRADGAPSLRQYAVPEEGTFVSNPSPDRQLQAAFAFPPGYRLTVRAEGFEEETWEVCVNMNNERYIWCREKSASAYFTRLPDRFSFTYFYGSRNTLLFHFYESAFSILLGADAGVVLEDSFPLSLFGYTSLRWLQDFVAPFVLFLQVRYESVLEGSSDPFGEAPRTIQSRLVQRIAGSSREVAQAHISIANGSIQKFSFCKNKKTIEAICSENQ
jgi:urea transporter